MRSLKPSLPLLSLAALTMLPTACATGLSSAPPQTNTVVAQCYPTVKYSAADDAQMATATAALPANSILRRVLQDYHEERVGLQVCKELQPK